MLVDDSCNFSKGSQFREHGDILDTNTPNQADEDKLLEKYMNTFEA